MSALENFLITHAPATAHKHRNAPGDLDDLMIISGVIRRIRLDHIRAQLHRLAHKRQNLFQVAIHLTGCPHSCAQHYMGDIGLLATTIKTGGDSVEAYHVFVGGGFGKTRALGRQIAKSLPMEKLKPHLEHLLRTFQEQKQNGETFQQFTTRHDEVVLAKMFANPEVMPA